MTTTLTPETQTSSAAPGPMPPAVAMTQMICGSVWLSKAIYVAAELGIADLVAAEPKTAAQLAQATGADPDALYRVLRALASLGIFAEDSAGRVGLTPLAATLLDDQPGSLRAMAILWGDPKHWAIWGSFLDGVRSGQPGWEIATGQKLFEFFAQNPYHAGLFDKAMSAFSGPEADAVVAAYDFSGIDTLVDVGGGEGLLLATVLRAYPHLRGMLFDLPSVVAGAGTLLSSQGVRERCSLTGGDFFAAVPAGASAYMMKNILHDFQDDAAARILSNCRQAMRAGGKVLVIQEPLPAGNAPSARKLLDMQMLLIGGRERNEADYAALFARAGLRLNRVVPTPSPLSVIEAVAG